jgi:hypothetical protein
MGGLATFLLGNGSQCLKDGVDVGTMAASIYNNERNQDVRASVNCGDGLMGSPIGIELTILRMLSGVARDCSHLWESGVPVDSGNHRINNQVHDLNKKSRTTTSPSLVASAYLRPRAFVTIAESGMHASLRTDLMTPTNSACINLRMPPLRHLTVWVSNDSSQPIGRPQWG